MCFSASGSGGDAKKAQRQKHLAAISLCEHFASVESDIQAGFLTSGGYTCCGLSGVAAGGGKAGASEVDLANPVALLPLGEPLQMRVFVRNPLPSPLQVRDLALEVLLESGVSGPDLASAVSVGAASSAAAGAIPTYGIVGSCVSSQEESKQGPSVALVPAQPVTLTLSPGTVNAVLMLCYCCFIAVLILC